MLQVLEQHPIYSNMFNAVLKSNKGINIANNNNFILKALVNTDTLHKFVKFQQLLKDLKLKLNHFSIGFNTQTNKYQLVYEIESKTHNNPPIKIDRFLNINVPFSFIPNLVNDIVNSALNDVPVLELIEVSKGN